MKISLQNRGLKWHPFLDFNLLTQSLHPSSSKKVVSKKQPSKKWNFIHQYLEESKIKNLYKKLHGLYRVSLSAFESHQQQGHIQSDITPLEEQKWFINFLKGEVEFFSCEEIWTILLNIEQRDKYVEYLEDSEDWQPFEIFIQNYWVHALSGRQLVGVFHLAFTDPQDSQGLLEHLFRYLGCQQVYHMMLEIKMTRPHPRDWEQSCLYAIQLMRNSQVKKIIPLIPAILTEAALEKLYPCEILEVVQLEHNDLRKNHLIELILNHYKKWWKDFSYQEIKETAILLNNLRH